MRHHLTVVGVRIKAICLLAMLSVGCEREKAPEREPEPDPLPFEPITVDGVLEPATAGTPLVSVSRAAIAVDGAVVIKLREGTVATDDLKEGALGLTIPRLLGALEKLPTSTSLRILVHREASYLLIYMVLVSARGANIESFEFLASSAGKRGVIRLKLPNHAPVAAAAMEEPCPDPAKRTPGAELVAAPPGKSGARIRIGAPCPGSSPVQLVLSVLKERAILWSLSGLEGTLAEPKLIVGADAQERVGKRDAILAGHRSAVRAALGEIVSRRGGAKGPTPREMVLQCDKTLDAETTLRWMAAIRHSAAGEPLFTSVLLSMGFQ